MSLARADMRKGAGAEKANKSIIKHHPSVQLDVLCAHHLLTDHVVALATGKIASRGFQSDPETDC